MDRYRKIETDGFVPFTRLDDIDGWSAFLRGELYTNNKKRDRMKLKEIEKEIAKLENKLWYFDKIKFLLYTKGISCLPDKSVYASIISNLVVYYKNSNERYK